MATQSTDHSTSHQLFYTKNGAARKTTLDSGYSAIWAKSWWHKQQHVCSSDWLGRGGLCRMETACSKAGMPFISNRKIIACAVQTPWASPVSCESHGDHFCPHDHRTRNCLLNKICESTVLITSVEVFCYQNPNKARAGDGITECFGLEGTIKGHPDQAPAMGRDTCHQIKLFRIQSKLALSISRDGPFAASDVVSTHRPAGFLVTRFYPFWPSHFGEGATLTSAAQAGFGICCFFQQILAVTNAVIRLSWLWQAQNPVYLSWLSWPGRAPSGTLLGTWALLVAQNDFTTLDVIKEM